MIKDWLADANPNVRRAVTDYFRGHPEAAIKLLSQPRADESEYVRKSVGNALRDISRKHTELIRTELENWETSDKQVLPTYTLASKFFKNST